MCGIAGSVNFRLDIPRLTRDLWHRGPDEQTTCEDGLVQLHHHRLAILDIAGGRQPMNRGNLTIIFNGEVYNHKEVREQFQLNCTTKSDTETILAAYEKRGPACLDAFDGMFALAIYDKGSNKLFIARDRAGKKPLYYYTAGNAFVFCSELNALQWQVNDCVNEIHLQQFVRMGYFCKSATPYKNIHELPAGSFATIDISI